MGHLTMSADIFGREQGEEPLTSAGQSPGALINTPPGTWQPPPHTPQPHVQTPEDDLV